MRLAYITNARIPSERANALQTVQMCAAFAAAGATVTLYHPARRNLPAFKRLEAWGYYGVPRAFDVHPVPCLDLFHLTGGHPLLEQIVFLTQTMTYAVALAWALRSIRADLYYARDPLVLLLLSVVRASQRPRMVFEAHTFPGSQAGRRLRRWLLTRIGGVVTITQGLRDLAAALGVPNDRILVAPDGVDLRRYDGLTRESARARLGLPLRERLVAYTGHLYEWKGAHDLAEAASHLQGTRVLLVGGTEADVLRMREFVAARKLSGVEVVGHVTPERIPLYQAAADVVVLPNSARSEISRSYTSPLKLFEYMASGSAIVASDLPSLREVLGPESALFVPADSPEALAAGVRRLLDDEPLRRKLATAARHLARNYTWELRAQRVMTFAAKRREEGA